MATPHINAEPKDFAPAVEMFVIFFSPFDFYYFFSLICIILYVMPYFQCADGAWFSSYDAPEDAVLFIVKFEPGSGSTPTLMGFGKDADRLVVITDGSRRMNLVAFWRDEIPQDFVQQDGTPSRRIAGQIPVTCGYSQLPTWIQSEQSVVVNGYGAFVVKWTGNHGSGCCCAP